MNLDEGNRVAARAKQLQQRAGQLLVPEVLANTENSRKRKHQTIHAISNAGAVLRKPPKHRA